MFWATDSGRWISLSSSWVIMTPSALWPGSKQYLRDGPRCGFWIWPTTTSLARPCFAYEMFGGVERTALTHLDSKLCNATSVGVCYRRHRRFGKH